MYMQVSCLSLIFDCFQYIKKEKRGSLKLWKQISIDKIVKRFCTNFVHNVCGNTGILRFMESMPNQFLYNEKRKNGIPFLV